jgi:hypothetical protein
MPIVLGEFLQLLLVDGDSLNVRADASIGIAVLDICREDSASGHTIIL